MPIPFTRVVPDDTLALRADLDAPWRACRLLDAADDRGEHAAPRQLVPQKIR
jgi:hypothetical protein